MKSGSWSSYQAALPQEARGGGEPDYDDPTSTAVQNIKAVIHRLEAWRDGERVAQIAAEERNDRHAAEGHYHAQANYLSVIETLKDALDDLE